jgi:hypothetical protein
VLGLRIPHRQMPNDRGRQSSELCGLCNDARHRHLNIEKVPFVTTTHEPRQSRPMATASMIYSLVVSGNQPASFGRHHEHTRWKENASNEKCNAAPQVIPRQSVYSGQLNPLCLVRSLRDEPSGRRWSPSLWGRAHPHQVGTPPPRSCGGGHSPSMPKHPKGPTHRGNPRSTTTPGRWRPSHRSYHSLFQGVNLRHLSTVQAHQFDG